MGHADSMFAWPERGVKHIRSSDRLVYTDPVRGQTDSRRATLPSGVPGPRPMSVARRLGGLNTGSLKAIRLGRSIRITRRSLEEFLSG